MNGCRLWIGRAVVEVVGVALTAAEVRQVEAIAAEMPDNVAVMAASEAAMVETADRRLRAQLRRRVQQVERARKRQPLVQHPRAERRPPVETVQLLETPQEVETVVAVVGVAVLPCKFDSPRRRDSIPLL
jgi:hypothetical protein